jgi:hypothetical protein
MHPFIKRLRLERNVISCVNKHVMIGMPRLHGLSKKSIKSWQGHLKSNYGDSEVANLLINALLTISRQIRLDSGNSHRGAMVGRLENEKIVELELDVIHESILALNQIRSDPN